MSPKLSPDHLVLSRGILDGSQCCPDEFHAKIRRWMCCSSTDLFKGRVENTDHVMDSQPPLTDMEEGKIVNPTAFVELWC